MKNLAAIFQREAAEMLHNIALYPGLTEEQAAAVQGIKVTASDAYVLIRIPALLPKKKAPDGFKFLVSPLQAAFEEYSQCHPLPHFTDCVVCVEHIYDQCLPITAARDYDNLEFKAVLDVIALYCMKDDTGALCDLYHTTRFSYTSCTMISVMPKACFPIWLDTQKQAAIHPPQITENP